MQLRKSSLAYARYPTTPPEVIYAITMHDILTAIVRRLGKEALTDC